jgi:tRNA A37 threonylcarbamoyladenosine biosynthesis protein TsaE
MPGRPCSTDKSKIQLGFSGFHLQLTFVVKFSLESDCINHVKHHIEAIISIEWPVRVLGDVHWHQIHVGAERESGQEFNLIEAQRSLATVEKTKRE